MIRLENTSKSVKVLKAYGKKTLRIMPGFNNVDCTEKEFAAYAKTKVNIAVIKESMRPVGKDVVLSKEDDAAAKSAMEKNAELNKAQRVITKQNEQILKKDNDNNAQATVIKDLTEANSTMAKAMEKMQKQLDKIEKDKK